MKIFITFVASAAIVASAGAASAQYARPSDVDRYVEQPAPGSADGALLSGRSAYVGRSVYDGRMRTDQVYGNGPDGQGVLAPHINGIF